ISLLTILQFANVMLGIKLKPKLGDKVELRLEKIDVALFVLHQRFEQVSRYVVPHAVTVGRRLLIERTRSKLGLQVTVEHLSHRLTDMQWVEYLHVGEAV